MKEHKKQIIPECGNLIVQLDSNKCINCNKLFKNSETQIQNSNYICANCKILNPELNNINFNIDKIISNLKLYDIDEIECKYCGTKIKKQTIETHYNTCFYYKFTCVEEDCKITCNKNDFIKHVIINHKEEMLNIFSKEQYNEEYNVYSIYNHNQIANSNDELVYWLNGTKEFTKKDKGNLNYLYSSYNKIKNSCKIHIKFKDCKNYNYCQIGFSKIQYNGFDKILGGEIGLYSWGLIGNGLIGEENIWNNLFQSSMNYSTEEITLFFDSGNIRVKVGNKKNSYLYNLGIKEAYLTVGLYYDGSKVIIIND